MLYTLLFVLLVVSVLATVQTFRHEYLVVVSCRKTGRFLLEGDGQGRYTLIEPTRVPRVVLRYLALGVAGAVHSSRHRTRLWARAHIPFVQGAKV